MEDAHAKTPDEVHTEYRLGPIIQVCRFFNTGADGLSEAQVNELRKKYGENGMCGIDPTVFAL